MFYLVYESEEGMDPKYLKCWTIKGNNLFVIYKKEKKVMKKNQQSFRNTYSANNVPNSVLSTHGKTSIQDAEDFLPMEVI